MLSPDKLVPHMFPVLGKNKSGMWWPPSVSVGIAGRTEVTLLFPLPCGAVLFMSFASGQCPKSCWTLQAHVLFHYPVLSVLSITFCCRCIGRRSASISLLLDVIYTWLLGRQQWPQPVLLAFSWAAARGCLQSLQIKYALSSVVFAAFLMRFSANYFCPLQSVLA